MKTGEPAGPDGPGGKKAKTPFRERPGSTERRGLKEAKPDGEAKGVWESRAQEKKRKAGRVVSRPAKTGSKRRVRRCQHGAEGKSKMREITPEITDDE